MCGIAGILKSSKTFNLRESAIKKMISALSHRGPDGWGIYISNDIDLGHSRLSIIDIEGGNQPMMTERFVISYNGEVYNYIELREELLKKGVTFKTASDTEVIIKSFETYGAEAVKKFNGQFAFLLWDRKARKLYAVRDRYGVRPLYILKHNGTYYFASEVKAFDRIEGYYRQFNMQNLYEHALLWNTLADHTVFENIHIVEPGTYEIYGINGNNPRKFRYYELGESRGVSPDTIDEAKEEFRELLADSIDLRLRSDVPVANYLSGGIDSSVVTYLTACNKKEKFRTYSVAFEDQDYDESGHQQEMAKQVNANHSELKINYNHIDENFLDAVYHFEKPVFRTAPVPLFLLSRMVQSTGIKVVLTGEAADEILWGYDSFKELKLLEFWNRFPGSEFRPVLIKKLYPHLRHYSDPRNFGLIKMFYEGFLGDYDNNLAGLNIRINNNKALLNYLNRDFNISFNREKLLSDIDSILPSNFNSWSLLQKNQFLEMKTLLDGYLLSSQGDRMAMAHGVEGRFPFLDHRLVERVFYYRDSFKLKGFSQKYLLRESYRDKIPPSITDRPKLPYMAPDLKSFIRGGNLTENAAYFLSEERIRDYGIFNERMVSRLIKKFENEVPEKIGYRDNMLITFILSAQMVFYHANNPRNICINENNRKVEITDL